MDFSIDSTDLFEYSGDPDVTVKLSDIVALIRRQIVSECNQIMSEKIAALERKHASDLDSQKTLHHQVERVLRDKLESKTAECNALEVDYNDISATIVELFGDPNERLTEEGNTSLADILEAAKTKQEGLEAQLIELDRAIVYMATIADTANGSHKVEPELSEYQRMFAIIAEYANEMIDRNKDVQSRLLKRYKTGEAMYDALGVAYSTLNYQEDDTNSYTLDIIHDALVAWDTYQNAFQLKDLANKP